jgi:tetratricopeptide (TPR) repeat protein
MKRNTRTWLSAILGGCVITTASAPAALAVTKEEIMTLAKLGIAADEIIKTIEKDRTVFDLSVAEILELKKANVPEKVIKYMLETPKKFGGGGTPAGGGDGGGTAQPDKPAEPTETPEQVAAREERLRQESQRLLEEKRRAEEAQRKAYADGVLKRGRELADDGKYVEAIKAFESFVAQGNFAPESEEAYFARFGIANALVKAGLLQAAAAQLVDLVLEGPQRPFFQTTFQQLRELRSKVNYSPPQLERLVDFAAGIENFSESFRDEFNYVVGEFFHEGRSVEQAEAFLSRVSPTARDYAKAQFLIGEFRVFLFTENPEGALAVRYLQEAIQAFQKAIIATEENKSAKEVAELSYLALARIAYQIGDYDAAIYYYRKIPQGSYKQAIAFYESGWVYFLKGDYNRAIGTFHALDSPYFSHYFYPEMWILEATAYLNTCHFDRAKLALQRFEQETLPLIQPLENFLANTQRPEEFFKALVSVVNGQQLYALPDRLVAPVLANVEFYNLYQTIRQIDGEIARVQKDAAALGPTGSRILDNLTQLRTDRVREVGLAVRLILREVLQEMQKFRTKFIALGVDMEDLAIEELDRRAQAADGATTEQADAEKGGTTAIIGSDTWRWPFEGEYWVDEIGSYRSAVADICVRRPGE